MQLKKHDHVNQDINKHRWETTGKNKNVPFYKLFLGRRYRSYEFWVSMIMTVHIVVLWVVMWCSLIDGYQYFRETSCLHLQGWNEWREKGIRLYVRLHKRWSFRSMEEEVEHSPATNKTIWCQNNKLNNEVCRITSVIDHSIYWQFSDTQRVQGVIHVIHSRKSASSVHTWRHIRGRM